MEERKDKAYYETSYYGDRNLQKEILRPLHRYRIRKVLAIYRPAADETAVDLGCAWGTFTFAMARYARCAIGIDFSSKAVLFSRSEQLRRGISKTHFFCGDAAAISLKTGTADVIVSADLFEHLYPEQFERSLDECRRILKTGGKLVIWTPHRGHLFEILKNNNIILKKDPSHVDYKSMAVMIEALTARGFRIVKNYYAESHLPVIRLIERALLPVISIARRRIAILAQKM